MGIFDELNGTNSGEYSHSVEPIPDGTRVLAYVEEAFVDQGPYDEHELVKLQWRVAKPAEYQGRVIFHKVKVNESDTAKRLRQLKMLQAIDTNAGGAIARAGTVNDQTLTSLVNKPMVLKLGLWEMDGRSGNWVMAVAPKPDGVAVPTPAPKPAPVDDGIPF